MTPRGLGWVLAGLLAAASASADPRVYFSSQDDVQKQILSAIDGSHSTLDAALFEISSPVLARALKRAAQRGVTVRLITSSRNQPAGLEKGWVPNLEIRTLAGRSSHRGFMHNKFAVFDRACIVTGSFNWTKGAEYANYENALFEDDSGIVDAYSRQFEYLWEKASVVSGFSTRARVRKVVVHE